MKLMLMPKEITWWVWLVTVALLAIGVAGHTAGFVAAVALSFAQTAYFGWKLRSLRAYPVQIRLAYALCLVAYFAPPLRGMYWVPLIGTTALLVYGYCLMARMLSLFPWNRSQPVTLELVRRTFLTPPIYGNVRHGLPARRSGLGNCESESMVGRGAEATPHV